MSETINYHLYLTEDDNTPFLAWREAMNGPNDSNMQKIDKALGEKADNSVAVNAALLASAWVGTEAPFTQELTIDGLTAEQNGNIYISQNATFEQRDIVRRALLAVIGQSENTLTIAADGEIPEQDIPVTIILLD